jgi:hypothetical protein
MLLPPWNEPPLYKCGRVATIDTWDINVTWLGDNTSSVSILTLILWYGHIYIFDSCKGITLTSL